MKARVYTSPTEYEDIEIPEQLLKNYRKKGMILTTTVMLAPASDGVVLFFGEGKKAGYAKFQQVIAPLKLFAPYVKPGARPAKEIRDEMSVALVENLRRAGMVFTPSPSEPGRVVGKKTN